MKRDETGRWHLHGRPLPCGTLLELHTLARWLLVRFEMRDGEPVVYLALWCTYHGADCCCAGTEVVLPVGDTTDLRWPA